MDSLVLNRLSLSDSRLRYGFSGVYSSDKLPKQRKRYRSFIVNTDPAHFKGRHWQAIYFRQDNHCVFFCSYGTRPQYDIEQFIIENSTSFEWNENILQHPNTMTCGLFCLYFLWHISRGLPINRLQNGNHCANERLVQNFVQSEIVQYIHNDAQEECFGFCQLHRTDPNDKFKVFSPNKHLFVNLLDCVLEARDITSDEGKSSARVLCGVINLPTPSQRFNKKESGLDTAVETVATVSLQIAAIYKEAKDVSGHSDIPVAIDGTWQKHGHMSLNGAVIATSFYTGKVLDASILSRFCKCPNKMHNENCKANHFRNSRSMEVSEGIEIFHRSKSLHGLRYNKFLRDGYSRAYKAVNEMQPYRDIGIEKLECIGNVEKWMGTRLRALKLKMKDKKLSDKKHWMITEDLQTLKLINYSVIMDWLSETIPMVLIQ
ncbi:uncharacterized protein TNCV_4600061 [Trichonephila clavipes]|nr:uncharacterized protein TNCV_4600061 [Trichonephila clavipes]